MVTKRAKRWLTRGATIGVLTVGALFVVATWIQAGSVATDWLAVSHGASAGKAVVVSVGSDRVVLRGGGDDLTGVWGLSFEGGRAVVGDAIAESDGEVARTLLEVSGALTPAKDVTFDVAVWSSEDAARRFDLAEVAVLGPEGSLPAWIASGDDDTWIVFVHGNGADRAEALRLLQPLSEAGYPALVAGYRNDVGAVPSSSERHGYGYDEWRDLEAMVDFALERGAADFILVGYGTGGSIVGTFLYESLRAERVVGVVLDSPVLSLQDAVHDAWRQRGVPGWAIGWTKAIASLRFGIDLGALDHVERASEWEVPTLVLHGREEDAVSLDAVEAFVIARDDALLLTFPNAGPGASWNSDPDRYESAVAGFVDEIASPESRFEPFDLGR